MSTPTDPPASRRAARQAQLSAHDAQPEGFAQPATRRGRGGAPVSVPSSAPTDVAYRTQVRPRVSHYDEAPQFGRAPEPLIEPPVAPSAAADLQVRRRDFRPPAEQQPEAARVAPAADRFDTALEYQTQFTPLQDARPADPVTMTNTAPPPLPHVVTPHVQSPQVQSPQVQSPQVQSPHVQSPHGLQADIAHGSSPPYESDLLEQTLSRRELRALRDPTGLPLESMPSELVPPDFVPPALMPPAGGEPTWAAPPLVAPTVVAPAPVMPAPVMPALFVPPLAPASFVPPPAPASFVPPPAPATVVPPLAPASFVPPPAPPVALVTSTGSHWSVGIDDDDDPFENTLSREVGSTASLSNTNALVLPEMPSGGIAGPVAGTGEIIITGIMDLSRAVSSTGTMPTVHESPDIDDLFDPGDLAAAPAGAAPVSALLAVSSHTGTHGVMASSGKRRSSTAITTVLVASTVIMAVVAIGLFVLAAVNGLF